MVTESNSPQIWESRLKSCSNPLCFIHLKGYRHENFNQDISKNSEILYNRKKLT